MPWPVYCNVTWYDDCPEGEGQGGGACGTCNNKQDHCAWTNLEGFDPKNSLGRCNECGDYSYEYPLLSCGDTLHVVDRGTGVDRVQTVADHGPWGPPYGCVACVGNRCVDLTEYAFSRYRNIDEGIFAGKMYV